MTQYLRKRNTVLSVIGALVLTFSTQAQIVTTLAGSTGQGSANGTGTKASFFLPVGVVADTIGNLYVVDRGNAEIRKIVISTGVVTTLAGSTTIGSADGTGTNAHFDSPYSVTIDKSGNLYVADVGNNAIRKIVIASGVVTTLHLGTLTYSQAADSNTTTYSITPAPFGITTDGKGHLYVADYNNSLIEEVDTSGSAVTLLAGTPKVTGANDGTDTTAEFLSPAALTLDGIGNLYVADENNNEIRKIVIATGVVTTIAGSYTASGFSDGTGTNATFHRPYGITNDNKGNLYVSDFTNNEIRKIVISDTAVTTLAGTTTSGALNGTGTVARFSNPFGITVDKSGNLYVADDGNNEVRKIVIITPPSAYFKASSTTVCLGGSILFTDTTQHNPTSWNWTFQNGTPATSTAQNPTVIFNTKGIDSVKLVVTNAGGSDSLTKIAYIQVDTLPTVAISGNSSLCIGADILTAFPVGKPPFSYSWSTNGSDDTIKVTKANTYSLTISDSNGCKASSMFKVKKDSVSTAYICVVTTDTASKYNVIEWNTTGLTHVDSFKVYYLNSSLAWQLIREVPFSAPNYLVDTTSINNPNANTVRYCLTAVDSCGNEEPITSSPWQNTMHINQAPVGTFTWSGTGYLKEGVVVPVITYYLFRDSLSNGNWRAIDSVNGKQNTMSDAMYQANQGNYPLARWVVGAKLNDSIDAGCTVSLLLKPAANNSIVSSTRSNIQHNIVSGIDEVKSAGSISVYPNPVHEDLNIKLNYANNDIGTLSIIDVTGRVIIEKEARTGQNIELNIAALSNGIYFVVAHTATSSQTIKFIKQ